METKNTILQNDIAKIGIGTLLILTIPIIGRFPWGILDFVFMGLLIFGTGVTLNYVWKKVDKRYRIFAIFLILLAAFLVWTEMAVDLVSQLLSGELWIYDYLKK